VVQVHLGPPKVSARFRDHREWAFSVSVRRFHDSITSMTTSSSAATVLKTGVATPSSSVGGNVVAPVRRQGGRAVRTGTRWLRRTAPATAGPDGVRRCRGERRPASSPARGLGGVGVACCSPSCPCRAGSRAGGPGIDGRRWPSRGRPAQTVWTRVRRQPLQHRDVESTVDVPVPADGTSDAQLAGFGHNIVNVHAGSALEKLHHTTEVPDFSGSTSLMLINCSYPWWSRKSNV
jgi:hypothetical protein